MDLEAYLRTVIAAGAGFRVDVGTTDENRVLIKVYRGEASESYLIVGSNTIHAPTPVDPSPLTQRVSIPGFDAHRGMGEAP